MTNIDKPLGASRDQTWLAGKSPSNGGSNGKIIHLNMGFSGKPCLIRNAGISEPITTNTKPQSGMVHY
jgi:hypothetical protein